MNNLDNIVAIANDYAILPHDRLKALTKTGCPSDSWAEFVRDEHISDLKRLTDNIDAVLDGDCYKYMVTVTAKPSTIAKTFHTHLCKWLEKFFGKLCGKQFKNLRHKIKGYVSVEQRDKAMKQKPIHAHVVFNLPPEVGKKLVPEVRAAAKYAAQYPKNGIRVLHPRRAHACTIRRRNGESLIDAQRRTAKYLMKTLHKENAYRDFDYGPGIYLLCMDKPYRIQKVLP